MVALKSSLQIKLFVGLLCTTVCAMSILGWQWYHTARAQIEKLTFAHLQTVRETKKSEIEQYFDDLQKQCLTVAESTMIIEAMQAFKKGFLTITVDNKTLETYTHDLKQFYEKEFLPRVNEASSSIKKVEDFFPEDPRTIILQTLYIAYNPNPLGKKSALSKASDASAYTIAHALYHDIFLQYIKRFDAVDMYLVDIDTGYVVFNISKEIDFATNLVTGPFKETNLTKLFEEIKKTTDRTFVALTDFSFHDPSYGEPVGFVGTPIYQGNTKIGCLIFELPMNAINNVMTYDKRWQEVGLGDTGETYIIGPQFYMRTISRPFVQDKETYLEKLKALHVDGDTIDKMRIYNTTIFLQKNMSNAAKDVINGITNTRIDKDYLQEISLSSYTPLEIPGLHWGLIAEIDLNEAFAPIKAIMWRIILLMAFIIIGVIIWALFFIYHLIHPLNSIVERISQPFFSFKEKIPVTTSDEIGTIAQQYNELGDRIAAALYTIQTTDNSLAQALQDTAHKIQEYKDMLEHESFISSETKEMLAEHINQLAALHKQCQDLEKQLHDILERVDF